MFLKLDRGERRVLALAVLLLSLGPTLVDAQTVVDATTVEFSPSAHHDALEEDGTPIVTSYVLQIFQTGAAQVAQSVNLGKPSPQGDGQIRVNFISLLSTPLTPGQEYEARVAASGPGGLSPSTVSNRFSYTPTCAPTLSGSGASLLSSLSNGSMTVTAAAGCTWSATSPAGWLTITSGASGSGTGSVGFSATANSSTSSRSATLTIANQPFTVTQAGTAPPCAPTLSGSSASLPSSLSNGSMTVTAAAGCTWSAISPAGWLTITSGASSSGTASVGFRATANSSTSSRSATLTIANEPFTVTQAGTNPTCAPTISPGTRNSPAAGESLTVTVTAGSGCGWTAVSGASWLTVTAGASGSANGTVAITVAANTAAGQRVGSVAIAGRSLTVTQSGVGCSYTVAPGSLMPAAAGGSGLITVTTSAGCTWSNSGTPSWMTLPAGTRSGSATLAYTIAPNTAAANRTGTLSIAGRSVPVTQAGAAAPAPPSRLRVVSR